MCKFCLCGGGGGGRSSGKMLRGWRISREERGGGEQSEAEHNNCGCVHNRGSSNMRALGHWKALWGICRLQC